LVSYGAASMSLAGSGRLAQWVDPVKDMDFLF
jgi:hypothetical protein